MLEAPVQKRQKLSLTPSANALADRSIGVSSRVALPGEVKAKGADEDGESLLYSAIFGKANVALTLTAATESTRDTKTSQIVRQAHVKGSVLTDLLLRLQASSDSLQAALDLHSLPSIPAFCTRTPDIRSAKELASLAHKLSYTTFAPTRVLGHNLFRPPAPQGYDFRASILHELGRQHKGSTQQPAGVPPAEQQQLQRTPPVVEPEQHQVLEPAAVTELPPEAAVPEAREQAHAAAPTRSALDFILNPDFEEAEEFSSSEDESD